LGVPVVADRGEDEPCRAGVGREPLGGLRRCARDRNGGGLLGRDAVAVGAWVGRVGVEQGDAADGDLGGVG